MIPEYKLASKSVNVIHTIYHTVPNDWQVYSLNNFAQEIKERFSSDKEGPILSVTKYKGFVESLKYFKKRIYSKDTKDYKLVEKGDFAYATIHLDEGSLGLLKEFRRGYISPMYTVFRTNSSIDKDFLFYLLKSNKFIQIYKSLGEGSINRRKSISFDDLSKLKIPIPTLNEQQKIALNISKVDELIQKISHIIEQIQNLKKGLSQSLLSRGMGHNKFKKIKLGLPFLNLQIPEEWTMEVLNNLVFDVRGGAPLEPQDFTNEGFPVLHKGDIKPNDVIEIGETNPFCSTEFASRQKASIIDKSYLVVTLRDLVPTAPSIGLIAHSRGTYLLAQGAYGFHYYPQKIDSRYLVHLSNSPFYRKYMKGISVGSTQIHIRTPEFLKIEMPLPSLKEQQKIASVLSGVDSLIKTYRESKSKMESLKNGLMQKLLTGKIRVKA